MTKFSVGDKVKLSTACIKRIQADYETANLTGKVVKVFPKNIAPERVRILWEDGFETSALSINITGVK